MQIAYICLKKSKFQRKQMRAQQYHQNYIDNCLLIHYCQELNYIFLKTMTSWKQVKTFSEAEGPCPRWGHAMCEINDQIYIFGGYENSKYYNDLWKFNLKTLQFSIVEQSGDIPPPSSNFSMNYYKEKNSIIIFGGGTLNKQKLNTIYELNLQTHFWTKLPFEVENPQPWQRSYHCSEIIGHFLIVTGGEFFHDLDDLWLYDLKQNKWTEVKIDEKDIKPKARKFAASVQYKNRIYIIGGCSGKYQCVNDIYYMDFISFLESQKIEDLHWTQVKLLKSESIKRWGHGAVIKEDKAFIFGGRQSNKDLQNLVQINLNTEKCSEVLIEGNLPKGRRKPGMCLKNNTIFCLSGFDGGYVRDFIQLNLYKHQRKRKQQKQTDINIQSLEQGFGHSVQKLTQNDYYTKVRCYLHLKEPSLLKKQFLNEIICSKHLNNVKYFKILQSSSFDEEQFQVYRPDSILDSQVENLVEIFMLYLLFGQIYLNEECSSKENHYLDYLLQLSDYYGIEHLENIIRIRMAQRFDKSLKQKKFQLKRLIEDAYYLFTVDKKLGQQAGYELILRLVKHYQIKLIKDKMKQMENVAWCDWLLFVVEKYQYQFQQYTLHKEKGQSENQIPQLISQNNEKLQTTSKGSSYFFGLFGAY